MPVEIPVAKDDQLWISWERYIETEEYANTQRWALHEQHVDGSLWAAFEAGYRAGQETLTDARSKD